MTSVERNFQPRNCITPDTQLKPGQVFFADIPLGDCDRTLKYIGVHPWLILRADGECVEAVLCSTGNDPRRHKYNANKEIELLASNRHDYMAGNYNLPPSSQYPPFSRDPSHTTIVQTENRHMIPYVELFREQARLAADGQTLVEEELSRITRLSDRAQTYARDPYGYLADEDRDWSVDAYVAAEAVKKERRRQHAAQFPTEQAQQERHEEILP